jgi:hypothetical protein
MSIEHMPFQTYLVNPTFESLARPTTVAPEEWHAMPILDRLLIHAKSYAAFALCRFGGVPRTFWAVLPNGELFTTPFDEVDNNRREFCAISRPLCIGLSATACVVATEAWNASFGPKDELHPGTPPSEASERDEVLIFAEERGDQRTEVLRILRTTDGDFFAFDEVQPWDMPKIPDVFSLFPQAPPSEAECRSARGLIKEIGCEECLKARQANNNA